MGGNGRGRSCVRFLAVMACACATLVGIGTRAGGATLPPGFSETAVNGLTRPTALALAPDGRVFVCEQPGQLRVIKGGALLPTPFLTATVDATGERGLLGVAVDPAFSINGYVYVYYTATTPTVHNRLSRFTAIGDVAAPGSERVLLDLEDLGPTNHNGGAIHFGPDGRIYVGVGENATGANAQSLFNKLGKMLRLNADGSIPSDNPFIGATSGTNRAIWALGLRNPFTFAFHARTGAMFINDVGQNTWEEINDGRAGANYGWPTTEGVTSNPAFVSPRFVYGHAPSPTPTTGCAIAGGAFYDADVVAFPAEYVDTYFFADLCSGWIRRLDPSTNVATTFASGISGPVDLAVSRDGALFYLAYSSGSLHKVTYAASRRLRTDYDADGKSDVAVFRPSNTSWYILRSTTNTGLGLSWGASTDVPVPADYDGDGKTDIATFRGSSGTWFIVQSSTGAAVGPQWGMAGDTPMPADYDGDGKADLAVYRPSAGTWFIVRSSTNTAIAVSWGTLNDLPVPGDFDGDGKADPTVFRPSTGTWYEFRSTTGSGFGVVWGVDGDTPIAGDFDGDGRADPTVFRPSTGTWYEFRSTTGSGFGVTWGVNGDQPMAGDYDGDGKLDPTVFRPTEGRWYQLRSTTGTGYGILWGNSSDLPLVR